jgi:hypothetical protein
VIILFPSRIFLFCFLYLVFGRSCDFSRRKKALLFLFSWARLGQPCINITSNFYSHHNPLSYQSNIRYFLCAFVVSSILREPQANSASLSILLFPPRKSCLTSIELQLTNLNTLPYAFFLTNSATPPFPFIIIQHVCRRRSHPRN